MAHEGRHAHPADRPGPPRDQWTRRGVIASAGAAAAAVGGRTLLGPFSAAADESSAEPAPAPAKPWKHAKGDPRGSDVVLTAG